MRELHACSPAGTTLVPLMFVTLMLKALVKFDSVKAVRLKKNWVLACAGIMGKLLSAPENVTSLQSCKSCESLKSSE